MERRVSDAKEAKEAKLALRNGHQGSRIQHNSPLNGIKSTNTVAGFSSSSTSKLLVDAQFSAFNVLPLPIDETGPELTSEESMKRFYNTPSILTQQFSRDRMEKMPDLYTMKGPKI